MKFINVQRRKFFYGVLIIATLACPQPAFTQGLHGYISCDLSKPPAEYSAGIGFYSAVWPLIDKPIDSFQIGLPSTWIVPDNSDDKTVPLCPEGTLARQWPERGPTWGSVFQTIEGGLGYWAGNRFHYGPPKFSMNGTPSCYDLEVASPGWSFFYNDTALKDGQLGIAQLSNRLLVPPDGLPFKGHPNGELLGYSYMALPFRDAIPGTTPTGDQSWTLFLNSSNFKGPVAYYIPETWSRISKNYPYDHGRGLDARPGIAGGGAIEINTVPLFTGTANNTVYTKIPRLQFPVDASGKTVLVRDVKFYSKDALYNGFRSWREGGEAATGAFDLSGSFAPKLSTRPVKYDQSGQRIDSVNELITPTIFGGDVFGLQWHQPVKGKMGYFPEYFKQTGSSRVPIAEAELPAAAQLKEKEFSPAKNKSRYVLHMSGAWTSPGPAKGPFEVKLADGSTVTYFWYRFTDQPAFSEYNWSAQEKEKVQSLVEHIHRNWTINGKYMPEPGQGKLVTLDPALIVTPPKGMEVGYVPIVTGQMATH